ncbi:MAG: M20 family metallopeptidase [Bacillota bacterium]
MDRTEVGGDFVAQLSQEVLKWTSERLRQILGDLERLVMMDSPPTHKKGVDEVGECMSQWLGELGFEVQKVHQTDFGNQVVAQNDSATGPHVLILGHLDTVHPVGSAARRPFRVEGNLARGPGVADDKSGLVGLVWALRAVHDLGLESKLPRLRVVLSSDEEANSIASKELILDEAKQSDVVIGIEPGRPQGLVTSRSGAGQYFVEVQGLEAHAGTNPQDGASAVVELAHRVIALNELTDLAEGNVVNVGTACGGRWINLVPGSARAEVQSHFVRQGEMLHRRIVEALEAPVRVPRTVVRWHGGITHPAWEPNQKSEELKEFVEGIGRELGIDLHRSIGGGAADCNFVAPLGLPVVDAVAPVGGNLHTEDEYLLIDTIPERVSLLALVLIRLGQSQL